MRHPKIYFLLIIIIVIWGLSWPVIKIGLQYMPPLWYAAFRMLIGMLSMFIIVAVAGKVILPTRKDLPIILVMGLLQMATFMILINLGLSHVEAGRSAILVYTTPIWVMPLAVLFFHEQTNFLKWIGFALGLVGILILFSPSAINWSDPTIVLGNGILLLSALVWAISMLCARNMKWPHAPFELVPWQLLVGTIPIFLIASFEQPFAAIQWNPTLIGTLLFACIFATAVAYWGTMVISKELPSTTASLSFLAVPVAGLLFSALLLGEPITLVKVIAMTCILGGIFCEVISGRRLAKDRIRVD